MPSEFFYGWMTGLIAMSIVNYFDNDSLLVTIVVFTVAYLAGKIFYLFIRAD